MSEVFVEKSADEYELDGWSICPSTRLLVYKPPFNSDQSYEKLYLGILGNEKLETIYIRLGLKIWGRVGTNDLIDRNYVRELKRIQQELVFEKYSEGKNEG